MTLIAFATHTDHAEILTDTWSYDPTGRHLGRSFKVIALPQLDAVIATQGEIDFTTRWMWTALPLADDATGFDDFAARAAGHLAALWDKRVDVLHQENLERGTNRKVSPSTVFHIGYSESAGRFRAVGYASDTGFEPFDIDGLYAMPSPLNMRIGPVEAARYDKLFAEDPRTNDAANLEYLKGLPQAQAPTTPQQWADLAIAARSDRSTLPINTRMKVFVGGDVYLTRVARDEVTTARLLTFADDPDELAAIFAGTLHPIGQAAPCPCGSGNPYAACCLTPHLDKPCLCGSGATLRECCLIEVRPTERAAAAPRP